MSIFCASGASYGVASAQKLIIATAKTCSEVRVPSAMFMPRQTFGLRDACRNRRRTVITAASKVQPYHAALHLLLDLEKSRCSGERH
ncbi:hypothetical protein HETIRDRAFT_170994 [Heterobasidion irregulare TC 32-1]|uniref:Uncharacterized protein n=1 Tax=Heterobasidion irregulare (strain TC 32-1) TaxID=747525 RepID=W4KFJ3_HETIT|nr:uncharacterized protein HETIRDRAFT_170994 [Heterobasidion irregulare TC 32-1]ETW84499.1 hypothetical protein HETIRDRAFT_170994 [Heterobasidion irregulare TC 32-1]